MSKLSKPACTKFGQSILRKIFKIVATICHLLRLEYTKFDFGWGEGAGRGRGRKGWERRGKGKKEGGEERRCAVRIFNYFRLWVW